MFHFALNFSLMGTVKLSQDTVMVQCPSVVTEHISGEKLLSRKNVQFQASHSSVFIL